MKIKFAFAALLASLTIAACAPKQEVVTPAPAAPVAEAPVAPPAATDAASSAASVASDAAVPAAK